MAPSLYSPGALTGAVKHPQDTLGRAPEAVGPRLESLPGCWLKKSPLPWRLNDVRSPGKRRSRSFGFTCFHAWQRVSLTRKGKTQSRDVKIPEKFQIFVPLTIN